MSEPAAARPPIKDILAMDGTPTDAVTDASEEQVAKVIAAANGITTGMAQAMITLGDTLGRALRLKTNRSRTQTFAASYVAVARGLFLALNNLKYPILTLFDTPSGAYVEARLPIDLISIGGSIKFAIVDQGAGVEIAGSTQIDGMSFDLGKGRRALDAVFAKIDQFSTMLNAVPVHGA